MIDTSEKFCGTCKSVKFTEEFNARSDSKDGKAYKCRDCTKLYNKLRYAEQRDILSCMVCVQLLGVTV